MAFSTLTCQQTKQQWHTRTERLSRPGAEFSLDVVLLNDKHAWEAVGAPSQATRIRLLGAGPAQRARRPPAEGGQAARLPGQGQADGAGGARVQIGDGHAAGRRAAQGAPTAWPPPLKPRAGVDPCRPQVVASWPDPEDPDVRVPYSLLLQRQRSTAAESYARLMAEVLVQNTALKARPPARRQGQGHAVCLRPCAAVTAAACCRSWRASCRLRSSPAQATPKLWARPGPVWAARVTACRTHSPG